MKSLFRNQYIQKAHNHTLISSSVKAQTGLPLCRNCAVTQTFPCPAGGRGAEPGPSHGAGSSSGASATSSTSGYVHTASGNTDRTAWRPRLKLRGDRAVSRRKISTCFWGTASCCDGGRDAARAFNSTDRPGHTDFTRYFSESTIHRSCTWTAAGWTSRRGGWREERSIDQLQKLDNASLYMDIICHIWIVCMYCMYCTGWPTALWINNKKYSSFHEFHKLISELTGYDMTSGRASFSTALGDDLLLQQNSSSWSSSRSWAVHCGGQYLLAVHRAAVAL